MQQTRLRSRVTLLFQLAVIRGLLIVLEQPAPSLLEFHPRFQALLDFTTIYVVRLSLKPFGGHTEKKVLKLYSNNRCIEWMARLSYNMYTMEEVTLLRPMNYVATATNWVNAEGRSRAATT